MIDRKKKLLREDMMDLNQLEEEMYGTMTRCGVPLDQVVKTKYYPKRIYMQ